MDIKCVKCGEPWDMSELHEMGDWVGEELSYSDARERFYATGCEAFGSKHGDGKADAGIGVLYDLLGDDVDGAASLMEDLGI